MMCREVSVIEVREVPRAWLAGKSERAVAAQAGVDRKTSRSRTAPAAGGQSTGCEVIRACGKDDAVDLDTDVPDWDISDLGYDSLAVLQIIAVA